RDLGLTGRDHAAPDAVVARAVCARRDRRARRRAALSRHRCGSERSTGGRAALARANVRRLERRTPRPLLRTDLGPRRARTRRRMVSRFPYGLTLIAAPSGMLSPPEAVLS